MPPPFEPRRPPTPLRRDAAADAEQEDPHWHGNQPGTGVLLPKADGAITRPAHAKRHGRSGLLTVPTCDERRGSAGSAGAGRREVSAVSALLARGRQASRAAERSRMWCLGRASQSDGCLAPPPAVRHGRVLCGRPWKSGSGPHDTSSRTRGAGHVVELQRTSRDRQISHQKKQSFLLRFDDGDATSLSGTTPAKTVQSQFHMWRA